MQEFKAYRSYLIGAAIFGVCLYLSLIVWIALRPSEVLAPDEKAFCLVLLIMLPGKYALEWVFKKAGLSPQLQKRLSSMAFVGLLVGLLSATNATDIVSSGVTFLVTFVIASIAFLVLDFSADWLWSRWRRR